MKTQLADHALQRFDGFGKPGEGFAGVTAELTRASPTHSVFDFQLCRTPLLPALGSRVLSPFPRRVKCGVPRTGSLSWGG